MLLPTSSAASAPSAPSFKPSATTTTTTTTLTRARPTPYTVTSVWGLICLYVWFECKERTVTDSPELARICSDLAKKHAEMFVEGKGVYDHPACESMRAQFAFSPDDLCKSEKGDSILKKGQTAQSQLVNKLIPMIYKSAVLDPPNYTFASGKGQDDLLLDMKRLAWIMKGSKDEFKSDKQWNAYHTYFFAFLVASPLSDFLYRRPGSSLLSGMHQGPKTSTRCNGRQNSQTQERPQSATRGGEWKESSCIPRR